jgi:hypothetical protein
MALTSSNTYIEPVASVSLNTGRIDVNKSLNALLSNFKSTAAPTSVNLTQAGQSVGPQEGMLFRSDTNKAFYVYDPANYKGSSVGSGFTRVGIGTRVEEGETGLKNNAETYEIGELAAVVSNDPSVVPRLYLCSSNSTSTGTLTGFTDVGTAPYYTVNGTTVEIGAAKTSVLDFDALGEVVINGSYTSTSRALQINSTSGPQGHAFYSKAYQGPAFTADGLASSAATIEAIAPLNNYYFWCSYNGINSFVGGIRADTASSVQYVTSSDYRIKENVEPLTNSIERLKQLNLYSYNFIDSDVQKEGVLAHELAEVIPSAVTGKKDAVGSDGKPILQGVDYSQIVPLLASALQEAISRIETLEQQLKQTQ